MFCVCGCFCSCQLIMRYRYDHYPFYRWENWSPARWYNLLRVTELLSGRASTCTQGCLVAKSMSFSPWFLRNTLRWLLWNLEVQMKSPHPFTKHSYGSISSSFHISATSSFYSFCIFCISLKLCCRKTGKKIPDLQFRPLVFFFFFFF